MTTYDYEDINPDNTAKSGHSLGFDLLDGVRSRRVMAFLLDYLIIIILTAIAGIFVGILGIFTFGAAWLLYAVLAPLVAIAYVGLTMGGAKQATVGMQFFAIKLERLEGGIIDPTLAILHSILFWVIHSVGTPFMLIVSMFSTKKRLLQDVLLGTVVVRSDIG